MKFIRTLLPWFLAVGFLVVALVQFQQARRWKEAADRAASEADVQRAVLAQVSADFADLGKSVERLRGEQAQLQTTTDAQRDQIAMLETKLADAAPSAPTASAEEAHRAQPEERRVIPDRDPQMAREMAEQSAAMRLEVRYGAWLSELGLNPEREEALRTALQGILSAQEEARRLGGADALADAEYAVQLRDELAGVLTAQEMVGFDEYQAGLPERMLRQDFAEEVGTFAPRLSEATRAALVDVLVEEAMLAEATPSPDDAPAAYPLMERMDIYANAAERFTGTLTEAEASSLNRFLEQRQAQLGTTVQMIERTEAQGGTASVDMRDGQIQVRIEQSETRPAAEHQKSQPLEKATQSD